MFKKNKKVIISSCDNLSRISFRDKNDFLHRVEGPADIEFNSVSGKIYSMQWRIHGLPHRIGGPACITRYSIEWWLNGKCHRLDGPAVIYPKNPNKSFMYNWYIDGVMYDTELDWFEDLSEELQMDYLFKKNK